MSAAAARLAKMLDEGEPAPGPSCATCRSWRPDRAGSRWGDCDRATSHEGTAVDIESLAYAWDLGHYSAWLHTHAEFACNGWAALAGEVTP